MRFARIVAAGVLLAVTGCTAVQTADGQRMGLMSDEFRAYVERVFREQNRVADEVAFALEEPGAEGGPLTVAEQRLLDACAGVNELATASRDRRRLGLRRSSVAAQSVPQCEAATKSIAALLDERRVSP